MGQPHYLCIPSDTSRTIMNIESLPVKYSCTPSRALARRKESSVVERLESHAELGVPTRTATDGRPRV